MNTRPWILLAVVAVLTACGSPGSPDHAVSEPAPSHGVRPPDGSTPPPADSSEDGVSHVYGPAELASDSGGAGLGGLSGVSGDESGKSDTGDQGAVLGVLTACPAGQTFSKEEMGCVVTEVDLGIDREPIKRAMKVCSNERDNHCLKAAEDALGAIDVGFEAFLGLPVPDSTLPEKEYLNQVKTSMHRKTDALAELQRAYTDLLQLNVPSVGVACAVRVGQMYDSMATFIATSETPSSLDEEAALLYRDTLGEYIERFEEQAAGAYQVALQMAEQHGVEGQDVDKARARLSELAGPGE